MTTYQQFNFGGLHSFGYMQIRQLNRHTTPTKLLLAYFWIGKRGLSYGEGRKPRSSASFLCRRTMYRSGQGAECPLCQSGIGGAALFRGMGLLTGLRVELSPSDGSLPFAGGAEKLGSAWPLQSSANQTSVPESPNGNSPKHTA